MQHMVQSPLARCRLPALKRRNAWAGARAQAHVHARVRARAHAGTRARRRVAPTPINPGSRSRRPHGSSGGRTDLPTSEAGTAFRSSPRPVEARFESHARQLCASPIPQPCVLVLPYQALFLLYGWVSCATKRFQKNHKRLPYCRYHLCTGQKYFRVVQNGRGIPTSGYPCLKHNGSTVGYNMS